MEPPPPAVPRKKRKGAPPPAACSAARSLQDLATSSRNKRACRGSGSASPQSPRGAAPAPAVVIMTAPAASGRGASSASSRAAAAAAAFLPSRGLKRKVGCIDSATQFGGRRGNKRLDSEYDVGDEIGHGKFGSVRLCRPKSAACGGGEDEEFACKSLPKTSGGDTGGTWAHREVEIMQHLSGHRGVVTLRAVFEDADAFHLVMELCHGGRLLDEVAREGGKVSERRAAGVVRELMAVLKYCHEMGVVHRDVKPENVLLTKDGRVKLADFGLAVRVADGQQLIGVAGSPAYVAPEILLGNYSQKVDIWAAGVLLHVLLMGTLPFRGNSVEAIFDAIKTAELDLHSSQWASVSLLARDLIGRMLNRDVSSRPDAEDVLRHPWVLFYTESPQKAEFSNLWGTNKTATPMIHRERVRFEYCESSSSECSSDNSEEQDECGIVDALATAITQVRISEPKRSRLFSPANGLLPPPSRNTLRT